MAEVIDDQPQQDPRVAQFTAKLNGLLQKVTKGECDYKFPAGETEGWVCMPWPGQPDFLLMYTPAGTDESNSVEMHIFPNKNPRDMYDQVKEQALKEDSWGKVAGWVDSPKGFPNRNDYADVRLSGQEKENPRYVRWVQQTEGAPGGFFVRLETSYTADAAVLKDYADALWWIVNQAGYISLN